MNIKIKSIKVKNPDLKRCRCGKCDNKMIVVTFEETALSFSDGLEWIPREADLKALAQLYDAIRDFNISHDNFCFKAVSAKDLNSREKKE